VLVDRAPRAAAAHLVDAIAPQAAFWHIPESRRNRPIYAKHGLEVIEGRILDHVADASGRDSWTVGPLDPHTHAPDMSYSSAGFKHMITKTSKGGVSKPKCHVPVAAPIRYSEPPCLSGSDWSCYHASVGRVLVVHSADAPRAWESAKNTAKALTPRGRVPIKPVHKVTSVAVYVPPAGATGGAPLQFPVRRIDGNGICAIMSNQRDVAEGAHA
jgi:hypothetical protein